MDLAIYAAREIVYLKLECPLLTPLKRTGQISKITHFINQRQQF